MAKKLFAFLMSKELPEDEIIFWDAPIAYNDDAQTLWAGNEDIQNAIPTCNAFYTPNCISQSHGPTVCYTQDGTCKYNGPGGGPGYGCILTCDGGTAD